MTRRFRTEIGSAAGLGGYQGVHQMFSLLTFSLSSAGARQILPSFSPCVEWSRSTENVLFSPSGGSRLAGCLLLLARFYLFVARFATFEHRTHAYRHTITPLSRPRCPDSVSKLPSLAMTRVSSPKWLSTSMRTSHSTKRKAESVTDPKAQVKSSRRC